MNWTTKDPVEGVKYIVETETGCIFPAHVIGGTWWNYEKAFVIDCVKRWIVYPEGEEPNDLIQPEALLKYAIRDYKNMKEIAKGESEKVKQLKGLNRELVTDYNKLYEDFLKLSATLEEEESECFEKLQSLHKQIEEIASERDALKEQLEKQPAQSVPSKDLLKENKQMKTFLRSIMNTCDMVRDLEIA